jgi:hypothetical protein
MKYNHAYTVAFSLESNHPEGVDVTKEMLEIALLARLRNLRKEDAWIEACDTPFDTYEVV